MTRESVEAGSALAGFLAALEARVGAAPAAPPLPDTFAEARQVCEGDCVARFVRAATAAGMHVHECARTAWLPQLIEILRGAGVRSAYVEPGGVLAGELETLGSGLAAAGIAMLTAHDDDTLFAVDVSITGVMAAVAETGTLVCVSGAHHARGASLIPPLHVAVVDAVQVQQDLCDLLARLGAADLPANVNMITGPSKTADIEGILITGVHGPRGVHIVLRAEPRGQGH